MSLVWLARARKVVILSPEVAFQRNYHEYQLELWCLIHKNHVNVPSKAPNVRVIKGEDSPPEYSNEKSLARVFGVPTDGEEGVVG